MIDLNQLTEDSFSSAFRRFPDFTPDKQIQKIYEEVHELEDGFLAEGTDRYYISIHCQELTAVEEEVADVIISCLVFAKCKNIDIEKALKVKNEFNITRP